MRNVANVVLGIALAACLTGAALAQGPRRDGYAQQARSTSNAPIPIRQSTNTQLQPPRGFELTPDQQRWVDQVLGYWEHRSNNVNTYSCNFARWEYNPAFIRDPNTPWTVAEGVIKYAKPDKAMYRVDDIRFYQAPRAAGEKPAWVKREGTFGENWVCDGQAIFEYDYRNQQLIERILPEHMQGEAIADGPLPFLFGAKAAKLKQRYWIKPLVPPRGSQGEYWLLVKPKSRTDAANFEQVEIILDQKEFLPTAMQIYLPGGRERKVFQFNDRRANDPLRFFQRDFSKPELPRGWKKVVDGGRPGPRSARSQIPVPRR